MSSVELLEQVKVCLQVLYLKKKSLPAQERELGQALASVLRRFWPCVFSTCGHGLGEHKVDTLHMPCRVRGCPCKAWAGGVEVFRAAASLPRTDHEIQLVEQEAATWGHHMLLLTVRSEKLRALSAVVGQAARRLNEYELTDNDKPLDPEVFVEVRSLLSDAHLRLGS